MPVPRGTAIGEAGALEARENGLVDDAARSGQRQARVETQPEHHAFEPANPLVERVDTMDGAARRAAELAAAGV